MTGFLRRVLSPYQGTFDTGHFTAAWSVLITMSAVPTINSRVIDVWCGECGCCIYHASQGILMLGIALIQLLLSTLAGILLEQRWH